MLLPKGQVTVRCIGVHFNLGGQMGQNPQEWPRKNAKTSTQELQEMTQA
jgi:hypothetical protein